MAFKKTEEGVVQVITTETIAPVSSAVLKGKVERLEAKLKQAKSDLEEVSKLEK